MHTKIGMLQEALSRLKNELNSSAAETILGDVKDICLNQPLKEKEIVYMCSLLFAQDSGILHFLSKTAGNEQLANAKQNALTFLADIFEKFSKDVFDYSLETKNVCLSVFLRDKSSKTRKPAMVVVAKIIEQCSGRVSSSEMKVEELVEKLFLQLSQGSKLQPTVKQEILCVLGVLSQYYFENVAKYHGRILNLYISELKLQITSKVKSPDPSVVSGCLQGLTGYLYNFTVSSEEDPENSYKIYDYARRVIEASKKLQRFEMLRAALALFARHAPQFSTFLYEDYERIYSNIFSYCQHQNRDVSKIAFSAMESVLKQISETLNEKIQTGQVAKELTIFMYFVQIFQTTMSSGNERHLAVAVKGYGYFAAACKYFPNEPHLLEHMLVEILQRTESLCFSINVTLEEKVKLMPSFLESLASILRESGTVSPLYLSSVEKLVLFVIENFPKVVPAYHLYCVRSLWLTFLALASKNTAQQGFLTRVVYQGLLRTWSHPVVSEVESKNEGLSPGEQQYQQMFFDVTYKSYLPLWKNLLDTTKSKVQNNFLVTLEEKEALTNCLYNEILTSILQVISKLDFSASNLAFNEAKIEKDGVTSDPLSNLQAKNPNDFQIFINLVDFCQDLLPSYHVHLFENWVYKFGVDTIGYATKFPYVSGFYKLIALCLKICKKIKYFSNLDASKEKQASFKLFAKFTKEVVVRFQQYKDDLLGSCLSVVLALPPEIVIQEIDILVPALQSTFTLGLSYLPLALTGLKTLEYWCSCIPLEKLGPLLTPTLPLLTKFLQANSHDAILSSSDMVTLKSSSERGPKKISLKVLKTPGKGGSDLLEETQLVRVRMKVLHFLGSLGGAHNKSALTLSNAQLKEESIAWDSTYKNHLMFTLPFADLKVDMNFEELLPVVVQLATSVSDRQTRVASCELLQALVILMVGKVVQDAALTNRKPMDKLYRHVFPCLLSLACDVEQIARDLFRPLVEQLIHWFTNRTFIDSPETSVILDCIWEGMTESNDTALRDFSAQMLKEFVHWAIKQSTPKELEKSAYSIKAVLKRLYSYSLHPNVFKRLGASLAFNNIYTLIREEDSLVSLYSLEIVVHLVDSLAIAHKDDKSLGSQSQCKKAIDHMERILRVRASLFQKSVSKRRCPQCLEDGTLSALLTWLLQQCSVLQSECRHACMELLCKLSVHVEGCSSPADYIQILFASKGSPYFQTIICGQLRAISDFQKGEFNSCCDWLEAILASLDCLTWLIDQKLLTPDNLFSYDETDRRLFSCLEYFISEVSFKSVQELFPSQEFSLHQNSSFNMLKCTVVVRCLNFLTVFINNYPKETALLNAIWTKAFWKLLFFTVMEPISLGFEMTDLEIMTNLPEQTSLLLHSLKRNLPEHLLRQFKQIVNEEIGSQPRLNLSKILPLNLREASSSYNHLTLHCVFTGHYQLAERFFWPTVYDNNAIQEALLDSVWTAFHSTEPSEFSQYSSSGIKLGKEMLKLMFLLGCQIPNFIKRLLDGYSENANGTVQFVVAFKREIFDFFLRNSDICIPLLIKSLTSSKVSAVHIMTELLDFVSKQRDLRKMYGEKCLNCVLSEWTAMQSLFLSGAEEDRGYILILLSKVLLIDPKIVQRNPHSLLPQTFTNLLNAPQTVSGSKARVLELLPFFLGENTSKESIKDALVKLSIDLFPLSSFEHPEGSSKRNDLVAIYKKLLESLVLTADPMLFEFLCNHICKEELHLVEKEFHQALLKMMKCLPGSEQHRSAQLAFDHWLNGTLPCDMNYVFANKVLLPIICCLNANGLNIFFTKNVCVIMDILKEKSPKYSEEQMKVHLQKQIACFKLLELLYASAEKEALTAKGASLNNAYCKGKANVDGKELYKAISGLCHGTKKDVVQQGSNLDDLRRICHCAAYNTLMTVVTRTQTDEKFFTGFLFQESRNKDCVIWENILDTTRSYIFDFEIEDALEQKQQFISIRQSKQSADQLTVQYIASQYLSGSSLSADVSQFDFSSTEQAFSPSLNEEEKEEKKVHLQELAVLSSTEVIHLEQDDLNSHECMIHLVALIRHMMTSIISQPEAEKPDMPKFLEMICKKLEDENNDTPLNVKLFLGRLIHNCAEYLKPYAEHLVKYLLNVIASGLLGSKIDYYILELLSLCLSWATDLNLETEAESASPILNFLMKNCNHPRRDIFRSILEVIKTVVECWKSRLVIPYSVIFDHLEECSDTSKRTYAVGSQLLGVVLANGLPPYEETNTVEKRRCLKYLLCALKNEYKDVYAPTAEVVGMLFKYLQKGQHGKEEDFYTEVVNLVAVLMNDPKKKMNFFTCVNRISQNFSPFAERFLDRLLFILPTCHGSFTASVLEVILIGLGKVQGQFQILKGKGLLDLLQHRDESRQLLSCKILQKVSSDLTSNDWLKVTPVLSKIESFPIPACRKMVYEILMSVYEMYRLSTEVKEVEVRRLAKEVLLTGLMDSEKALSVFCSNFWSQEKHLPIETTRRLQRVISDLYSPKTEAHFLQYASYLLMEMTSRSPDFKRKIFDRPLSACQFQNLKITTSWRHQHAAMTPLFAETFSMDPDMDVTSSSDDKSGPEPVLRATQAKAQFSATHAGGSFDWVSQSSMEMSPSGSLSESSSLLFSIGVGGPAPVSFGYGKRGPTSSKQDQTSSTETIMTKDLRRLKMRFLKDKDKTRNNIINRNYRRNQMKEELRKERIVQREAKVTIYRTYRTGDLPDIEINYDAVIVPLQVLAQCNPIVAKTLMKSLVVSIGRAVKVNSPSDYKPFCQDISTSLHAIMKESELYSAPVQSFAQEILFEQVAQISLKPDDIKSSAIASKQQNLGILLLETSLIMQPTNEERSSKRARLATKVQPISTVSWIRLAELYKSIDSLDMVRGIFFAAIELEEGTKTALELESKGDFGGAVKIYDALYATAQSSDKENQAELDLWDDSIIECYSELTRWDRLHEVILARIPNSSDLTVLWQDVFYQEHYLPQLVRSKLKLILEGQQEQDLLTFIDASMSEPERKMFIESHLSEELALLYIVQDNFDRASYYCEVSMMKFLEEWSHLSVLIPGTREEKFQSLQKLTEMKDFLSVVSKKRNVSSRAEANRLVNQWQDRLPNFIDHILVWDDVICNRELYMKKFQTHLPADSAEAMADSEDPLYDPSPNNFDDALVKMKLAFVTSACQRKNIPVALKHVKWIYKHIKPSSPLWVDCIHAWCGVHHQKAATVLEKCDQVKTWADTWNQLGKLDKSHLGPSALLKSQSNHLVLKAYIMESLSKTLNSNGSDCLKGLTSAQISSFQSAIGATFQDSQVQFKLVEKSLKFLQEATALTETDQNESSYIANTHLRLAMFCNKQLQSLEDENKLLSSSQVGEFSSSLVDSLLSAMKYGSTEAAKLFPTLLRVIESHTHCLQRFIEKCEAVPCWMFLGSINQILLLLELPISSAVQPIVTRIADTYPMALVYPFKLRQSGISFTKDSKTQKQFFERIKSSLQRVPLVEDFVDALHGLRVPHLVFKEAYHDVVKVLQSKSANKKQEIADIFIDLFTQLFSKDEISKGAFHKKFEQYFSKEIINTFGKRGEKILTMKDAVNKFASITEKMKGNALKTGFENRLDVLSVWLSNFQSFKNSSQIEIPGQYSGDCKPSPENHVMIASFDQNVLVLQSLTQPRRLSIRGNDEKEYHFLVKAGEDLRQDNRIEHLFEAMNSILKQDVACASNKLQLATYKVIPITTRLGLIEWVPNTVVLKSFIQNAWSDDPGSPGNAKLWGLISEEHQNYMSNYGIMYQKKSAVDIQQHYSKLTSMVPWDVLRRAFLSLCSRIEAFVTLRTRFIQSHAVLCVGQWILGIGDRHLSNFLVSVDSGQMLGIDFGHSFGSATQFLPIPELMPFRLTPCFLNLCAPIREKGLLEASMVHTLTALRARHDLLLNLMDIFIKEPTIDWQNFARKQEQAKMATEDAKEDKNWYPKQRVNFASKKLNGCNPCLITREELYLGHSKKPEFKAMEKVCLGDKTNNVRARLPAEGLSPEKQVACLIDQASDANLLGRTWGGWEPWI